MSKFTNFLATDKVPETLFGFPVVTKDYTEEDLEFFREHPEAAGYYDLGDEGEGDGGAEGRAAEKGGDSVFHRNGNLKTEGRKRYLFRDADGKVTGYGTQQSTVKQDDDGTWIAIPTIIDGNAPLSGDDAFRHYKKTGEFFHRGSTREEAEAGAIAAHEESQAQDAAWWNNYIADHLNDNTLGKELQALKKDKDFMRWAHGVTKPGDPYRRESAEDAYIRKVNAAVADAIPFVKEHEDFREKAYKDHVGVWTIGYGQTEIDGRPVREGDTISEKNASVFLVNRMRENAATMYRQNPWTKNLSQGALSALYDVAYNLGVGALSERRSPNLNRDLNAATANHDDIVWRELPTYVNAGGQRSRGLVNRRNDAIRKWRPS